jgi:hypothetical protein
MWLGVVTGLFQTVGQYRSWVGGIDWSHGLGNSLGIGGDLVSSSKSGVAHVNGLNPPIGMDFPRVPYIEQFCRWSDVPCSKDGDHDRKACKLQASFLAKRRFQGASVPLG